MERITLQLTVAITATGGQQLPDQAQLIDRFTDYINDYYIKDKAHAQNVQVTSINGKQV